MSHMSDICEIKSQLIEWTKFAMAGGCEQVDTSELGNAIDMIKDCFEIEEHYWKSEYYKLLVEEDETELYDERKWYTPEHTPDHMARRGIDRYNARRGYVPTSDMSRSNPTAYERYEEARKHYTDSRSVHDKFDMESSANQYLSEAIASVKDIWRTAEPEMRERMKTDFKALVSSMT